MILGSEILTGTFTNGSPAFDTFSPSGTTTFTGTTTTAKSARCYIGGLTGLAGSVITISGTTSSSGLSNAQMNFSSSGTQNSGLTSGWIITNNGTFSVTVYVPANAANLLILGVSTGVSTLTLSDLSVRQILGNHATQATAANRPLLTTDSAGKVLLRHDSTDVLTASLPVLSGGNYSTTASVYFATNVGMSALHGLTIGTTYNLPALNTDIYGWVITPERLSAVHESRLSRYFERLAGLPEPDYVLDSSDNQLTADDGTELLLRA
jgi:hypothetical protein